MIKEYLIPPCSDMMIPANKGDLITVIDVRGRQAADFLRNAPPQTNPFVCGLW